MSLMRRVKKVKMKGIVQGMMPRVVLRMKTKRGAYRGIYNNKIKISSFNSRLNKHSKSKSHSNSNSSSSNKTKWGDQCHLKLHNATKRVIMHSCISYYLVLRQET